MPPTVQDVRKQVDAQITNYFSTQLNKANKLSPTAKRLWRVLGDVTSNGGKRLRPYIIVLAYKAYGGKQNITNVAAAWELMHSGLLIHDDIMDREYTRRGKPNLAGQYQKLYAGSSDTTHHANSAALLGGDLALVGVFDILQQSVLSNEQKNTATQLFCESLYTVIGGQLMDSESIMLPIQKVDTEKVALYKSAKYSFTDPVIVGATLAGASSSELAKLDKLGKAAGIGFQLTDDLLSMFGDERVTGKSASGDIREGKRTILLQETMARIGKSNQAKLTKIIGNPTITNTQVKQVRDLVAGSGAKQAVETRIEAYNKRAQAIIKTLQIGQEYKNSFKQLVSMVLNRTN